MKYSTFHSPFSFFFCNGTLHHLHFFPTRRSSDLLPLHRPVSHRRPSRCRAYRADGRHLPSRHCPWLPVRKDSPRVRPQTYRTGRDRKSTRLNSSHVKISYAVFCLKRKKNYSTTQH